MAALRHSLAFATPLALAALAVVPPTIRAAEPVLERDVLPVLQRNCLGCHGGLRQQGGLDLRTIPAMLTGGDSGPAVQSKDPKASPLWQRIESDEMPPHDKKLSAAEKSLLERWIAAGMPTLADRGVSDDPLLPAGERHEPDLVAATIDRHVAAGLAAAGLEPAPRSDDAEFLRRVFLDLTGRVPTAEQAAAFLDDTNAVKRARLIDELLATPQFGQHLGRTWAEWIAPPELPSEPFQGSQPYNDMWTLGRWLGRRFAAGHSWDVIVRDIVTAEGKFNVAPQGIFFILVGIGGQGVVKPTPEGSARAVGSLFMGVTLKCAECHDDPFRPLSQSEFWQLAAFFSQTHGGFKSSSDHIGYSKNGFGVFDSTDPRAMVKIPPTAFKNAGTDVQAVYPGGTPFTRDKERGSIRSQFADWLVARENTRFSRSFVNRTWFLLFSRGLVNPVDDLRELNPPSHPGLMRLLAEEFTASGYDVKHLFRCLCRSEAYQRTSRPVAGLDGPAITALTAAYGRMPMRVMPFQTFYESLGQVYGDVELDLRTVDDQKTATSGMSAPVATPFIEFQRCFGTNEEDATDLTHGIPQMLAMINHPRLLAGSAALGAFRRPWTTPEQTIEWLYLGTLSRRPTAEEMEEAARYRGQAAPGADPDVGILWSLVNRSEFLLVR